MKQGDKLTFEITGYGINGEGVARLSGFVVFIPFAMRGETVLARIVHVKKSFAYAVLLSVTEKSPFRVEPVCNRYGKCGGCNLLHAEYGEQLRIKKENLIGTLKKGGIDTETVKDVVPSDKQFYYRNKAQLPFGVVNGETVPGFYREDSHKIVSVTRCFLHGDWLERLIAIVREFTKKHSLSAYNEETKTGLLRHLVARYIGGHLCVVFVINGRGLPHVEDFLSDLERAFPSCSLYLSVNTEKTNVIMGKTLLALKPCEEETEILGIGLKINPLSFMQVNDFIRDEIYKKVLSEVDGSDIVVDVFSGVGLMGAVLVKNGIKEVYNIEIVPEAVEDARMLAERNGISEKTKNLLGDAAALLPELMERLKKEHPTAKISVILDPPRKGVADSVITALNKISPHKLIYISCNPASLARDLSRLDYAPTEITPYDMFANTKHVESVCLLTRNT